MPVPAPWYEDGLHFSCTQCGRCCGGAPGQVWISEAEIDQISDALGIDREAFLRRYTRRIGRRGISLQEKRNYDCIFFESGRGCTIYQQRPQQCRSWPFWRGNLSDRIAWDDASLDCPGMDQGRHYGAGEITAIAAADGLP